jgi:uncharacterized protein YbjT (DUF2867 family)
VILVTGATGRVGYHVMEALADARADVTAMVRVEAKAADLPGTPQHVVGRSTTRRRPRCCAASTGSSC